MLAGLSGEQLSNGIVQALRDCFGEIRWVESKRLTDADLYCSCVEPAPAMLHDFFHSGESNREHCCAALLNKEANARPEFDHIAIGSATLRENEYMYATVKRETGMIKAAAESCAARKRKNVEQRCDEPIGYRAGYKWKE